MTVTEITAYEPFSKHTLARLEVRRKKMLLVVMEAYEDHEVCEWYFLPLLNTCVRTTYKLGEQDFNNFVDKLFEAKTSKDVRELRRFLKEKGELIEMFEEHD